MPAPVLTAQVRRFREVRAEVTDEGWDLVLFESGVIAAPTPDREPNPAAARIGALLPREGPPPLVLQLSRFPDPSRAPEGLAGWVRDIAVRAEAVGFAGLALMDHLIQIPQVGRAWEPIPEPWVTLGLLAGATATLRLGTLVSPIGWRSGGILAKAAATLDALSGGRAFCGVGAGWWEREHAAFGFPLRPASERLADLAVAAETMKALWAPGTKAFRGRYVELPETTCYPRPVGDLPLIIGGAGERRTLRIGAELADAVNVPATEVERKLSVLNTHLAAVGRSAADCALTVLDVPVTGRDPNTVAATVERLRGRTPAAAFAARHAAGLPQEHLDRYRRLAATGVRAFFVAPAGLREPDDLDIWAPVTRQLAAS